MNEEERIICLSDIKRLYFRIRKKLVYSAAICSLSFTVIFLFMPIKFPVEATFKESKESPTLSLKEILGADSKLSAEAQAADVMKSRTILTRVIQKLGLQVVSDDQMIIQKALHLLRDNLKAQFGAILQNQDSFIFEDVVYKGEKKKTYQITFKNAHEFVLTAVKSKVQIEGIINQKVEVEDLSFTIKKPPNSVILNKSYCLLFHPLQKVIQKLQEEIRIVKNKNNKSLFKLNYHHRDKVLAARTIDALMLSYQEYLQEEHEKTTKAQLDYLGKRQDDLNGKLEIALNEHVSYLKENLSQNGFFSLDQEMQTLLTPHISGVEKMRLLELEEKRLNDFESGAISYVNESPIREEITGLEKEREILQSEKDLLGLSLQFCDLPKLAEMSKSTNSKEVLFASDIQLKRVKELKKIRSKLEEANTVFQTILSGDIPKQFLQNGITGMSNQNLKKHMEDYIRALSIKEKTLTDGFYYSNEASPEFEGIDLSTAKSLYVSYNNKLDKVQSEIQHLEFVRAQINDPNFETTSLIAVLQDPISQQIISKISNTSHLLKDEKNISEKEKVRFLSEIALQKSILENHLLEMLGIQQINADLFKHKIRSLQKIRLDRINQRLSILDKQKKDHIAARKKALTFEKTLLEKNAQELKHQMHSLPEKWRLENLLKLKVDIGSKMMEALTQIVESKTISQHLHQIQSKPLDTALLPIKPISPNLFLFTLLGALLGFMGAFFYWVCKYVFHGFPLSMETLTSYKKHCSGDISDRCDGKEVEHISDSDFETLRKAAFFLTEDKKVQTASLISGYGPNYSYTLANLLAKRGLNILLIQCTFQARYSQKDMPGILGYINDEVKKAPIRKEKSFDLITTGGTTRFGAEILGSDKFKKILDEFKKNYDLVIINSKALPALAEAKVLQNLVDRSIITVKHETADDLRDYLQTEKSKHLSFITT